MVFITKPVINQIFKKIKKYNNIVIARHVSPDPDAIASQMALRDSIRETFPNKKVIAVGVGVSKFKNYGILDRQDYENYKDSLLICLDVPNMHRVDGIDGLSASVSAIITTCLTVIAIILDVKEIVVFGSIIVGACLGFLIFNLNTARVFMGDTGSLLLGGVIAAITLYLQMPLILLIN